MALTDDVKVALRVSSNAYDAEVAALVAAAPIITTLSAFSRCRRG